MEDLSSKFKSIFLDLLKCLTRLQWLLIFLSLINLSVSIYEDQIGKFDWKQSYVGRIKFAQFDTVSTAKRIIVATEENVLAALNLKTGQVVWRHVFENTPAGNIELLHVSEKVLTVTGSNPYLVRGWDPATGVLLWEWSLAVNTESKGSSKWFVQQGMLVHVLPVFGAHVEVTSYKLVTGQNKGATSRFPAAWANEDCILSPPYYTCISKSSNLIMSIDVTSNAVQVVTMPSDQLLKATSYSIQPLNGNSPVPGFLLNSKKVVLIQDNSFVPMKLSLSENTVSATVINSANEHLLVEIAENEKSFILKAYNVKTSEEDPDLSIEDINIPTPELVAVMCNRNANDQFVCRILVNGADDSATLMQQEGRVLWTREEALANVVAAEFVDLPVSDLDAAIELEFDQKEGSILSAFTRRLTTQAHQLTTFFQTQLHIWSHGTLGDDAEPAQELVRDYFNLHKIIVLVTKAGKIYGMDNLSGELLWQRYVAAMDTRKLSVFVRRTARHTPYEPWLTIVARHRNTGNGLIVTLQPITGSLTGEKEMHMDTRILQAGRLPRADEERLHAVLILDQDESVVVLPVSASRLVENYFMYVAEPETARMEGYALKFDGRTVNAIKTWSLTLGGDSFGHRLVAVAPKVPEERVHSPGRVLADRSVLYKYLNPNLLVTVSEGGQDANKELLTVTCVDAVSGAVVCAQSHRRSRFAGAALHAGNCIAYAVYNDKLRRTEIVTMELYEGSTRASSSEEPFSSLKGDSLGPRIQSQSYIAAPLTAAAFTFTERGITDKHVLVALTTGAVVEMPWEFLDPRRPITPSAEQREEGLIPYMPELPYPSESVLNYNQTLERVSKIYTAGSGLESTSLVLATGLDIFYTRVAPSKTFDLIKDDFEYFLIIIVLGALIAATYGTKYLAQKKVEKLFWE